jgi:hypothetical protein
METLVIDIGGANLVVEKYEGTDFIVYFQDKETKCITQDIALIRQSKNNDGELMPNAADCIVWEDDGSEDYTHKFRIKQLIHQEGFLC